MNKLTLGAHPEAAANLSLAGPVESRSMLPQIKRSGHAIIRLTDAELEAFAALYHESERFLAQPEEKKLRHCLVGNDGTRYAGYRPHGYANAGDPEQVDENVSLFFGTEERQKRIPGGEDIQPLLSAVEHARVAAAGITRQFLKELEVEYGYGENLPFEEASWLQVNQACASKRKFSQTEHGDNTLFTFHDTESPGLEDENGKSIMAPKHHALILPGNTLAQMTGDEIPEFRHRVRNHTIPKRTVGLYFVNPDPGGESIKPYVETPENSAPYYINDLVRKSTEVFGIGNVLDVPGDI